MTGVAFFGSAVGILYGWLANRPGFLILSFWAFLIAFAMLMARDTHHNEAVREREALLRLHSEYARPFRSGVAATTPDYFLPVQTTGDHWATLDDLMAWPTAAPGTYPEEDEL